MNHWLILLTTLPPLLAEVLPYDLSADAINYDSNDLVLKGNITLNHDLGQMKGEVATINKGELSLEFSSIHLENNVSIFLESQGKLFSDEAFFDFQTMIGKVSSLEYPVIFKGKELDFFCRTINLSLRGGNGDR
ncbi:MAG: hypothetical protein P0S93_03265 [Candidatus Neptunochlamydia sp.]|nr:hypothetical protein [Candidatus Neptunochlamydia sp.]